MPANRARRRSASARRLLRDKPALRLLRGKPALRSARKPLRFGWKPATLRLKATAGIGGPQRCEELNPHDAHHDEVLAALKAIGNPRRGEAIRRDRDSALPHLGIAFPALRARVKQGFSFSKRSEPEVLAIWDALWRSSPYGDVLFAAIEALAPIGRTRLQRLSSSTQLA